MDKGAWTMGKIEPNLYDHEERIITLEGSMKEIQEDLRERYARIDESNKYLRELSQEQIKQNTQILNSVLSGNQDAQKREDELRKLKAKNEDELKKIKIENSAKFWLSVIGSGGILTVLINILQNALN